LLANESPKLSARSTFSRFIAQQHALSVQRGIEYFLDLSFNPQTFCWEIWLFRHASVEATGIRLACFYEKYIKRKYLYKENR
jgi:hypothetical protein